MIEDKERFADPIDAGCSAAETWLSDRVQEAMLKAADIPVGNPGECDCCGEWSGRLVSGHCSPCRDKYGV